MSKIVLFLVVSLVFVTGVNAQMSVTVEPVVGQQASATVAPQPLRAGNSVPPANLLKEQAEQEREKVREQIRNTQENFLKTAEQQREELRNETRNTKTDFLGQAKEVRQETREEVKGLRETMLRAIEAKREAFKQELEVKKEETKKQIEAQKLQLKEKLKQIKDERKKQTVERIANQINELNKRMLDKYSETLKKLESVLSRIATRMESAANRGLDVTAVKNAITDANAAIDNARNIIQNQTTKVYTVEVKTEDTLKVNVGAAREALRADLEKVKSAVQAARDAVHKAAITLGQLEGVNPPVTPITPTSTATTTQ